MLVFHAVKILVLLNYIKLPKENLRTKSFAVQTNLALSTDIHFEVLITRNSQYLYTQLKDPLFSSFLIPSVRKCHCQGCFLDFR